jgi:gas vesicle protein
MLRGLRTAIQYFTLGLALGLLLAPRKGEETRSLLFDQLRSYMQEGMSGMAGGTGSDNDHHPHDSSRDAYRVSQDYDDTSSAGPQ